MGENGLSFDPKNLVKLDLIASVDRVAAGAEFDIGAHFTMKPGWHIYWENPGESGLKTKAKFDGPGSVTLSEPLFPGPIEFKSPGDIVSYGYEHSAVVFSRARAAADLAADGDVAFRVDARWLACRQACVRGKASAELTVPTGAGGAEANQAILGPQRAKLPAPLSELSGATAAWSEGSARELIVRVPGARSIAFFPAAAQPATVAGHKASVADGVGVVSIRYRGKPQPSTPAGGVVRVESDNGSKYYEISVPWS